MRMTSEQVDEMERLWKGGVSAAEIARRVGCSPNYVRIIAMNDRRRFPRRVAKTPSAEAREMWVSIVRSGRMTTSQVAERTGYHPSTVRRWVREVIRGQQDERG